MEECSVLIETTKSAEDKTSRWFDLPIDYELFRDLLGVEADSNDYQITDMKLPFAGDIVRTTSVRRLNKLYFARKNFCFIQSATTSWTLPVTVWSITLNFLLYPKKERNTLIWKPTPMNWTKKDVMLSAIMECSNFDRWYCLWQK